MDGGRDGRFVRKDDVFCDLGIAGQEAPVDVRAVSDVGIVVFCRGGLEDFLHERLRLGLIGLLEEEFDNGREDLQLRLRAQSVSTKFSPANLFCHVLV